MKKSLTILAIDTSQGGCSVALWQKAAVKVSLHEEKLGQQSKHLVPMIEKMLTASGMEYADCDAIACTIGPGGFTGIRVGLTVARTLRLATNKPLIGLSVLEVMAHASKLQGDILSVIDAHRGQYYAQRFRRLKKLESVSDPMLVDAKLIPALAHGAKQVQAGITAEDVAALAHERWAAGKRKFPSAPLYIREPDAKLPAGA